MSSGFFGIDRPIRTKAPPQSVSGSHEHLEDLVNRFV